MLVDPISQSCSLWTLQQYLYIFYVDLLLLILSSIINNIINTTTTVLLYYSVLLLYYHNLLHYLRFARILMFSWRPFALGAWETRGLYTLYTSLGHYSQALLERSETSVSHPRRTHPVVTLTVYLSTDGANTKYNLCSININSYFDTAAVFVALKFYFIPCVVWGSQPVDPATLQPFS